MTRFLALAAVLLAQASAPQRATELRFGWPEGFAARVETERTRERIGDGRPTSTTMRGSYRMRTFAVADGLAVEFDQFKVEGAPEAQMNAAVEAIATMTPGLIVSRDGEFLRVADIDAFKAVVDQRVGALMKKLGRMPPGIEDLVARMRSESVLTAMAGQEWHLLVDAWTNLPLTATTIKLEMEEALPIWPDIKVPMNVTGGIVERTACTREVKRECIVAEMRTTINQAAMEPILKRLMSVVKPTEEVVYERIDAVTIVRIRLETETMVPHELNVTKTLEMTVQAPGKGTTAGRQIDRRTSRFIYR